MLEVREEAVQFESNSAGKAARVFGAGEVAALLDTRRQRMLSPGDARALESHEPRCELCLRHLERLIDQAT